MARVFRLDVELLREYKSALWYGDPIVPRFSSESDAEDFADEMVMIAGACLNMAFASIEREATECGQELDSDEAFQLMIDLPAAALFCGGITDPDEPYGKTPVIEIHCEEFRVRPSDFPASP